MDDIWNQSIPSSDFSSENVKNLIGLVLQMKICLSLSN